MILSGQRDPLEQKETSSSNINSSETSLYGTGEMK